MGARARGEVPAPAARAPASRPCCCRPAPGLSTPRVYAAFDRLPAPPPAAATSRPPDMPALAGWVRNDLWPPALALAPSLGATARALAAAGARAALLCGSGSCVAGLFAGRGEAEEAAARLPAGGLRAIVVPRAPER